MLVATSVRRSVLTDWGRFAALVIDLAQDDFLMIGLPDTIYNFSKE